MPKLVAQLACLEIRGTREAEADRATSFEVQTLGKFVDDCFMKQVIYGLLIGGVGACADVQ